MISTEFNKNISTATFVSRLENTFRLPKDIRNVHQRNMVLFQNKQSKDRLQQEQIQHNLKKRLQEQDTKSSATYVEGKRIFLERNWNSKLPYITILMYYPSTANDVTDDKTIKSCIKIAEYNNYGGIKVYNIHDSVKQNIPDTDTNVVLAWGMKMKNKKKCRDIIDNLLLSHKLLCFVQLKDGSPGLPTRLSHKTIIKPYSVKSNVQTPSNRKAINKQNNKAC